MPYGTVKVDNITFDQGGTDQNVTASGIYRAITSGVTVTGTISGAVLIGTTTVSGATVTGTAVQGTTVQGVSGTFTSLTGTTTTGTTANFVSGVFTTRISGTTVTGDTGQFTSGTFVSLTGTTITGTTINAVTVSSTTGTFGSITGTTITGTTINGATVNSTTGNFTSLTGVTVTGTTAQFASGVFTTQVSGLTVTGTQSSFTSGNFVTLSGATATFTSGVIASGTATNPSLSIVGDGNTGIYSPGADQLAVATNGVGRLFVDAAGGVTVPTRFVIGSANNVGGLSESTITTAGVFNTSRLVDGNTNPLLQTGAEAGIVYFNVDGSSVPATVFRAVGVERLRIDSSGRLLVGTSSARSSATQTWLSQIEAVSGLNAPTVGLSIVRNQNDIYAGCISFAKTRGTSNGATTIVTSGDELGGLLFSGADGSTLNSVGASIAAAVDGTPGVGDMPGRLVFSTTADGAASPTEAMRIKSTGIINFSNAPTYADNTAATAAGLAVGDVYKTVLGVLMIRF